mgnify:CR=1 FL=1
MLFHLGMEGLTADEVPLAQAHMWSALERVAETGVPPATLQAALGPNDPAVRTDPVALY